MFKYNPNVYVGDLDPIAVHDAIAHARQEFPLESIGAIIDDVYVPFINVSESPEDHAKIDSPAWFQAYTENRVDCIVHSHNDMDRASLADQRYQQALRIPSLILNMKNQSMVDCILFGTDEPAPAIGRPFFYGAFDCFSSVRDYLRTEHDALLPHPPYEWEFWVRAESPIEDMIESNKELPLAYLSKFPAELELGDVLLYKHGGTRFVNHIGVVVDKGLVLHHFYGRISHTFPVTYVRKYLSGVMRLK